MTDEELIAREEQIRHAFHRVERKLKALKTDLLDFANDLAASRGIGAGQRSGGDADDKDDEEPPQP